MIPGELVAGPGGASLLYFPDSGGYVRVSQTGAELFEALRHREPATPEELRFAAVLLRAASRPPQSNTLRWCLWRPDRVVFAWAASISARTWMILKAALWTWLAIALAITIHRLPEVLARPIQSVPYIVLPGMALLFLQLMVHELCHVFMAGRYGVRVRGAGVGLLYRFLPVGYTDLTDSYRLSDQRQRAWIALAGPALDLTALAVSLFAGAGPMLVSAQLGMLAADLVVLLPSDGCRALEALLGGLDVRGRAFSLLWSGVTGGAVAPHLRGMGRFQRGAHMAYAALAIPYTAAQALGVAAIVRRMAGGGF